MRLQSAGAVRKGKKMNKTDRIQIRVTPEQKEKLQELAEADGRNVSNYVLMLVQRQIEQQGRGK